MHGHLNIKYRRGFSVRTEGEEITWPDETLSASQRNLCSLVLSVFFVQWVVFEKNYKTKIWASYEEWVNCTDADYD
jgi:hypothetical protein